MSILRFVFAATEIVIISVFQRHGYGEMKCFYVTDPPSLLLAHVTCCRKTQVEMWLQVCCFEVKKVYQSVFLRIDNIRARYVADFDTMDEV